MNHCKIVLPTPLLLVERPRPAIARLLLPTAAFGLAAPHLLARPSSEGSGPYSPGVGRFTASAYLVCGFAGPRLPEGPRRLILIGKRPYRFCAVARGLTPAPCGALVPRGGRCFLRGASPPWRPAGRGRRSCGFRV